MEDQTQSDKMADQGDQLQTMMAFFQEQAKESARREERMAQLLEAAMKAKQQPPETAIDPQQSRPTITPKVNVAVPQLSAKSTLGDYVAWKESWNDFSTCQKLNMQDKDTRIAALRQCLDEDFKRYMRQGVIEIARDADVEDHLLVLEKYIREQRNPLLDRLEFYEHRQDTGESFNGYYSALKEIHNACDFPADAFCATCTNALQSCITCKKTLERLQDEVMRDKLITGISDEETRHRLLSTPKLTLEQTIHICRSSELPSVLKEILMVSPDKLDNKTASASHVGTVTPPSQDVQRWIRHAGLAENLGTFRRSVRRTVPRRERRRSLGYKSTD